MIHLGKFSIAKMLLNDARNSGTIHNSLKFTGPSKPKDLLS